MRDFKNMSNTILITGASRGIGQALALHYAKPNVRLVLIATNNDKLLKVAKQCRSQGAEVVFEALDVRDTPQMQQFIKAMDDQYVIDVVIANAGIATTLKPNWQPEESIDMHNVIETNVQGLFNTITPLIKPMISRKSGQIALVSSLAALRGLPQSPSYCASKAAVLVYAQSLRAWLSNYQIKVSVICPGFVETDMSSQVSGLKPFLVSKHYAVKKIVHGLNKNKARIAFPWPLVALMQLARNLPEAWVNKVLSHIESYQKKIES